MNVAIKSTSVGQLTETQKALLTSAGQKIAPTWPLDQMIAVNPFWQMRDQPIEQVSARVSALDRVECLMPKAHYRHLYAQGEISQDALQLAAEQQGIAMSVEQLAIFLNQEDDLAHWHNIADLLDNQRDQHKMAWRDEIIHQISQFCAAYYQQLRPIFPASDISAPADLYRHWLDMTRRDRGISIIMDEPGLQQYFQQLPPDAETLLAEAVDELGVDDTVIEDYAHALLLDINGWASWVAYLRWQGDLHAKPCDEMLQLLAIRMAWELVIWRYLKAQQTDSFAQLVALWLGEKDQLALLVEQHEQVQKPLWVWAKAAELSYQAWLNTQLINAKKQLMTTSRLQAAFCIDVRSEVIRRALENQSDDIQTIGFAGFFGLPLEYQPHDSELSRPQLPGLLKPVIQVSEWRDTQTQVDTLNIKARWQTWSQAAPSAFSMVESMGWLYAFKMLKRSFFATQTDHPVNALTHQKSWLLRKNAQVLSVTDKAELAKGILHAMGLDQFAATVLLVGHGSHTSNNLHAAGLDCGACGGQSGEVNVRVLAQLLNDQEVRKVLTELGITIPAATRFVAALHNTTTDHIDCFDTKLDQTVASWLQAATETAQRERIVQIAPSLANSSAAVLDRFYTQRSHDWSQVRPEWGLANNAAFIVAPRCWTRNINLQGRSFLHDYQWQNDDGFAVLELIMTAPMVVTNWINMQYNASVSDNLKYGCGNKLLHNAVAGHIGVFEGNGGDLRIGLSMQSLHDGEKWMHQPQRLAVYLAAPRQPIEQITAKHDNVRWLIDNQWLYLLRWSDEGLIERYYQGQWLPQETDKT
ncbi:YbcC family protein [Shewanella psychromarinicola]|uniref:Probable inorganic carbon transporter subunit DabA n=1 Tax=Shewanella psychromarinicola TaxID=2487742 RepID=A0A3N4EFY6_9GAMM|nr:DUF2309 domain-containing protein [Shewanella psychromarinicola]AZG35051.1 DUF2309 domain-containing protein [Shewanella psychromarinicola]MCL1082757.1 DUF2309 domain-containing protein [Shewanella psychromarinicola]RPA33150.1 DUF2309 domain-containing protein [Shewanella psychromarinicola]